VNSSQRLPSQIAAGTCRWRVGISIALLVLGTASGHWPAVAQTKSGTPPAAASSGRPQSADPYQDQIRPFLARHCLECHGEKPKSDLRLDGLSADFADAASREQWLTVLKRVKAGEMPPKPKPRPSEKEVQVLGEWIDRRVAAASPSATAQGRVVLRRLNRVEYENTVRDLSRVPVDLKDLLPVDTSAHGFDNVGEALHTSSFLMEKYLEAADTALGLAIANARKPQLIKKRYSLKNQHGVKNASENVFRKQGDTVVLFSSSAWQAVHLYEFYPPDRGKYRFRISASGYQSAGKPVTYRVDAGLMGMVGKNHLVGYFDAPPDKPAVIEFVDHLEARSTIRILPYGLASAQSVHKIGADKYTGPGLAVQWVEVEGPLHDTWPPASHRRIFGDLPQEGRTFNGHLRFEVVSKDLEADAERILRGFTRRAFRRAVTDDDIKPFLALVKTKLAAKHSFEQSARVGLMAVMLSPEFLFLREKPGKLDDFALASRLSYFLWSTMPDEELLTLAQQRKLAQPGTLHQQVERMLKDPKAAAFTENFVGQWLNLRDIDFTEPSHILYPEFDEMLKASMLKETHLFFDEVLKNDLSLTNFVASDFTMLNGRLARHYGIVASGGRQPPDGWEFRKVPLPADSHRGGVLTMASVLKVTANGTTTSPVLRGVWLLERILGTPPPKPPADVPAIEPDIRGATTIRQQLAKHRQIATCASCHTKIDPPGFALESFDPIGGWRENYRTTGRGETVMLDGRRMPYLKGPKVDPADEMPGGQRFADIDEFKQLLLKDKDQLARSLTVKLVTYATGAAPSAADRTEIEAIVRKVRERNYGFRWLVHEIVQSEIFRRK
jgi:mono/diheme cytochrome c family protein